MNLGHRLPSVQNIPESVHYSDPCVHTSLVASIKSFLPDSDLRPLIIICIGTDRSTGDALGPLVGTHLKRYSLSNTHIYGTLDHPVHAANLERTMTRLVHDHQDPFVIAVDACLGRYNNVGKICVSGGPVIPGAGVNKKLAPVGDMNIVGVVNVSGFMEYSVLQSTRLSLVMALSKIISRCLYLALFTKEQHRPLICGSE